MKTVFLPGWGNSTCAFDSFKKAMKDYKENRDYFIFDYAYKGNIDVFLRFEYMDAVFKKFLNDHQLYNHDELNIVGYSEGGMIGLYFFGLRGLSINKYVSIASPHRGAFNKDWRGWANTGGVTYDFRWDSDFLTNIYPAAAKTFFKKNPIERLLQIWSADDSIAIPESSRRFIDNKEDPAFNNKMISCEVEKGELSIPQFPARVKSATSESNYSTLDIEYMRNIDRFFKDFKKEAGMGAYAHILRNIFRQKSTIKEDTYRNNCNEKLISVIKADMNHCFMPYCTFVVKTVLEFLGL